MKNNEAERDMALPLGQLVKMTAPVFLFGVILPFVDMATDLRMIIRLWMGVPSGWGCQDSPGGCELTEKHPIFASMLLGKYI